MNTMTFNRYFTVAVFMLTAIITNGQTFSIGGKTGLINSKFVSNSQNSSRNAFYFGLIVNKRLNRFYSLQAEINYSSNGNHASGMQPISNYIYEELDLSKNTVYYASYKKETILSTIEIPLLAKVSLPISMHFKYYTLVGPYISLVGKAKNKASGTSMVYKDISGQIPVNVEGNEGNDISFDKTWNAGREFRKINIGAEGGIGVSYGHPCKPSRLFIEGRFGMNISNIHKSESVRTDKNQNSTTVSAGLLYIL